MPPSHDRRRVHHGVWFRERRGHGGGPAHHQRRPAIRSQPRHQRGPARGRFHRTGNRRNRPGLGTLYTWNIVSPRLGVTVKLSADGRTILRGSYGRFSQGMMTGEIQRLPPGVSPTTTTSFDSATRTYTLRPRVVDPRINLQLDPETRAPHTDEYSIGLDREIGRRLAMAVAYVHKRGTDFIGWTDIGGKYLGTNISAAGPQPDGVRARQLASRPTLPVDQPWRVLPEVQRARDGRREATVRRLAGVRLLHVVPDGWAAGFERDDAAGAQSSTVALPTVPIGRDPNDLTNARGRLPNDRPHVLRA